MAVRPFHAKWKSIEQRVSLAAAEASVHPEFFIPAPAVKPMAEQFIEELTALGGSVIRVAEKDLPDRLNELLASRGVERVLVDEAGAGSIPALPTVRTPDPTVRVGVTGALTGIAETGSIVVVSGKGRPLTASLLPQVHIALLKTSSLVPTLEDALRRPEIRAASASVIITGPSRTADIEMTLTIGVHGPGELIVFLIDDSDTV